MQAVQLPHGRCHYFVTLLHYVGQRDMHVFKDDDPETVNQLSAFLMREVLAPVRYPLVDASDNLAPPRPFWRSLRLRAQATLRSFQITLIAAKEARVVNRLASRECGEFLKTDIHANSGKRHVASDVAARTAASAS